MVRRVREGPVPLKAEFRWRHFLQAAWALALAGPFLQSILLPPQASAEISWSLEPLQTLSHFYASSRSLMGLQMQAASKSKPGPVLKRGPGRDQPQAWSKPVKSHFFPQAQRPVFLPYFILLATKPCAATGP